MSITGNLSFYSTVVHPDPKQLITQLIEWTGAEVRLPAEQPFTIRRSIGEDREWELFQTALTGDEYPPFNARYELLYDRSLERIPEYYVGGAMLSVDLGLCPQGKRIATAIREGIPEAIRGGFAPGDVFVRVGRHDIFEEIENGGRLIARPFAELSLFGYSCPNHWAKMREITRALPAVVAIREELSALMGPVDICLLWDT